MRTRNRTGLLAVVCALLTSAAITPGRALPPGPPSLGFGYELIDGFTYELTTRIADPDGDITMAEVCIEDACSSYTFDVSSVPSSLGSCLLGDEERISLTHTFPAAGLFEVTVRASGGGCPALGSTQTSEATFEVGVTEPPEPPPPHEPILCAQPGETQASAPGVDPDSIVLATTVQQSGLGAATHGEVPFGLQAAASVINSLGGVCDRSIQLRIIDDGGDPQRRRQYLQNLAASGEVFAFVAQEVDGSIDVVEQAGIPAVGTPATSRQAFAASWVWPIQAGNDAFGWISVEEAYEAGARRYAVVYEKDTVLGEETKEAVEAAAASHEDVEVTSLPLASGELSYAQEINSLSSACGDACDAVIYALRPGTLLTWMGGEPPRGRIRDSVHPVMFTNSAARSCGNCDGLLVWTDLHPPIQPGSPGEATRFCDDLAAISPQADCLNPHTEAAYAAVFVAARAMGLVGADLTREALADVLDADSFDPGLTGGPLSWTPLRRQANRWMRGYKLIVAAGSFAGWRTTTGWVQDPRSQN